MVVGSFAAIPLVFFFAKKHFAKAAVEKKLAAFSAQGLPLTPEELQASYAYPEGENAAFLYTDAFSKIVITNKQGKTISDLLSQAAPKVSSGKIPLGTLQAMDEVLEANQAALNLIREGNRIGDCRYPIDLRNIPGTSLPHLGGFRQACRLLHLEAEARLARSDAKGAYNSILNGFQLAQSLSKEPLLISHLVRCGGAKIMLSALEQFLNQHPLTTEQIDELKQWLSAAQNPAPIRTALNGELCMSLHYYRKGAIQTVIEWDAIQPINHRDWETPFGEMPLMLGAVWMDSTSLWHKDCEFMLNAFEKLVSSLKLPAHQRREFLTLQSEKLRKIQEQSALVFLLSEEFLPAIVKSLEREPRFLARVRLAALALAIERRLANGGRIPSSLKDLPAKTLETFRTNPYTGERMRYFILENGYRLLSAEPDDAFEASFTVNR